MGTEPKDQQDGAADVGAMMHVADLAALIEVAPDSTVSRTVLKAQGVRVVLFSFDAGQELTEHTAAVPVLVQVLDGQLRVGVAGKYVELAPGGVVHIAAPAPHEILARTPARMALTMLDPRVTA
ncbi:MAG: cupin domain-containing protein [Candidatus Nanopelagicales bacterium]